VDLTRFPDDPEKGPSAFDCHRTTNEFVVGKVMRCRVEADKLVVSIRFTEATERGRENLGMVRDRTLQTLSIGYAVTESETTGDSTRGESHVIATEWTLREVSTAALPADPDAQLRSHQESRMADPVQNLPPPEQPPQSPVVPPPGVNSRSIEQEGAAARALAARATDDEGLQDHLVRFVLEAEDFDVALVALESRVDLLHSRTADPKLRAIGGKLIAEATDPLTVDVIPALRKALAERTRAVGTPPIELTRGDTPPTPHTPPKKETPAGDDLAGFAGGY